MNTAVQRAAQAYRVWEPPWLGPVRILCGGVLRFVEKPQQWLAQAPRAVWWAFGSPKSGITSAGNTMAVVAGQDSNHLAAQHWAMAAKDGIVLYTYGQASNKQKPNQETGIQLHAASGNVNSQSQSGSTHVVADKAVNVSSAAAGINASAPQHILLTAGGAGIRISGGNITLSAPGTITFKAGMKNFTGGASASASVALKKPGDLYDERFVLNDKETQAPIAGAPYSITNPKGEVVASGITDDQGRTVRLTRSKAEALKVHWGK